MRPLVLLFLALFNSILGLSVLFPILAPLGRELALDEVQITSLSTAYAFMQLVTTAFWGRRSDWRGRKPILLIGILGFSVTFFGFAIVARLGLDHTLGATSVFVLLLATRVIGGAFSSATLPTAQAYAADVSERDTRTSAMAVIGAAFGLGVIFGPVIGAVLAWFFDDLLAPVYFSASLALLNALFVWLALPEPTRQKSALPPAAMAPLARRIWPLLSVAIAATVASVAMEQTVAFYIQDRLQLTERETPPEVGIALVGYGVVAVLSQAVLVRRMKLAPTTLLRAGVPIALLGFVLFIFATERVTLIAALLIQGLGQGLLLPGVTSAMSLAVTEDDQGAVAGLNSSAQGLGRTLGPIAGGLLYGVQMELPYVFSAALLTIVLLIVLARPAMASERSAA